MDESTLITEAASSLLDSSRGEQYEGKLSDKEEIGWFRVLYNIQKKFMRWW